MKNTFTILLCLLLTISVVFVTDSSALEKGLRTEAVKAGDIKGSFTVIFFGGQYLGDVRTIAFLDLEGDGYTFEPYAPEFDYRVKKGLSAEDAMREAQAFVSSSHDYMQTMVSKILDTKGNAIGFEVRPLYRSWSYGLSDVLDVVYSIRDDKVKITVRLKPQVERQLQGGGSKETDH